MFYLNNMGHQTFDQPAANSFPENLTFWFLWSLSGYRLIHRLFCTNANVIASAGEISLEPSSRALKRDIKRSDPTTR